MGHADVPSVLDHDRRADGPEIIAWLLKLKRAQSAGSKGVSIVDIAQISDGASGTSASVSAQSRIRFIHYAAQSRPEQMFFLRHAPGAHVVFAVLAIRDRHVVRSAP